MATDHLQIPDIQANQNQKEVTANAAHNLLDRAMNANISISVSAGENNLTTTQARENFVIELIGTPGAAFQVDMPDTNKRTMAIYNNSNDVCTVRNSANGGAGQPVINVGEASIFHYDGVDFIDLTALAIAASTWLGLTDTPGSFAGQSGQIPSVDNAEGALEFIMSVAKLPVVAATTAAGTLATDFENGDVIDGVTLATGDRILIKNQATASENGVYTVNATGAPTRTADFDDNIDVRGGALVPVANEGTVNGDTVWMLSDDETVVIDTDNLTFVQMLTPGTFTSLTDTPANYTNQSGMAVRVNSGETALEFVPTDIKIPVRVATTVNGALATAYENGDTVDGVTLATGDRILIKDQTTASENGLYTVNATGAPTRALDFDANDQDVILGALVAVLEGTANANLLFMHTAGTNIGVDNITFAQAGGSATNRWTEATVQTTDATITNLATIALASGEAKIVRFFGIGTLASSANSFAFNGSIAGKNNGGTSAILATAIVDTYDGDGGNSWAFTADVDDTTDTIRLRVTGQAATTIDWRVQYEVVTEDNT